MDADWNLEPIIPDLNHQKKILKTPILMLYPLFYIYHQRHLKVKLYF